MKNGKTKLEKELLLRKKAEEVIIKKKVIKDPKLSYIETLELIHELDVHQIELEMQNEELLLAKKQAEINADKFTDLYDFAPSGYLTLSKDGEIMELNFMAAQILGQERSFLTSKRFAIFLADDCREVFSSFLDKVVNSNGKETCEVLLKGNFQSSFVYLTGVSAENGKKGLINLFDITERKKAEEDLRLSEDKYRTLFEANRDSITIFRLDSNNKPSNFIEANEATTTIFGYTKKELESMSIRDFESTTEKVKKNRIETLQLNGRIDFETVITTKNKKNRNVEVKLAVINYENQPALMCITRDITERKQLEENTKKAQENLETILDAIPDLLFEVDLEGRIYHYHSHRSDLLAVPPSVFMGKLVQEVLPDKVSKTIKEAMQEADEKGWSMGRQYELNLPQGKHWFEISVSPIIESSPNERHFIILSRDITDRRNAEIDLQKSKAEAEENNRLKSIFLANMSHEIRTPMNGILGFTELLKDPNLSQQEQQEYIDIIEKSGVRMLSILNDIISISKVESGQVEISLSETNINEQMEYLFTFFKPEANHKGIQLSFENNLNFKEATITTDSEKIYAVLTNLIKNALKFTDTGFIQFGYVKKGKFLEFYVKDTGLGIADEKKKIIFGHIKAQA